MDHLMIAEYCEILANLCALNLFDKDVDSCKILDDIYSDRTKWTDEAPAALDGSSPFHG